MKTDNRFTTIADAEFESVYAAADERMEKDYRSCSRGPLIQFAKTAGKVTHMRYIGGGDPKALRCNPR